MTQDNNNAQVDGHLQGEPIDGVGQDAETQTSENPVDWEQSAKYFQSEKDKLAAENQQLQKYKQLGNFLESRPDLVEAMKEKASSTYLIQETSKNLDEDQEMPAYTAKQLQELIDENQLLKEKVEELHIATGSAATELEEMTDKMYDFDEDDE